MRYLNTFYISCALKYFGYRVKENIATVRFGCVFFLCMRVCISTVYMPVSAEAQDPSELELWTAVTVPLPPHPPGASARAANALSLLTSPSLFYMACIIFL